MSALWAADGVEPAGGNTEVMTVTHGAILTVTFPAAELLRRSNIIASCLPIELD